MLVTDRDRPVARLVPVKAPAAPQRPPSAQAKSPSAPALGKVKVKVKVRGVRVAGMGSLATLEADRSRH